MNKLEMVMQMITAEVRRVGICSIDKDKVSDAWKLADAMQAEAHSRSHIGDSNEMASEWQPDWSKAPRHDVVAWDINEHGQAKWIASDGGYYLAPSFGYKGKWQDSLRKRP